VVRFVFTPHVSYSWHQTSTEPLLCYTWYQLPTYPTCVMSGISCPQYIQGEPMEALIKQAGGVFQQSHCHEIHSPVVCPSKH
jgi:hypothetical protein